PRLYVEVLSPSGKPLPLGERGEITVTGGFNFCLPLLRYRTGDYASLRLTPKGLALCSLEGRPPVRFRTTRGDWINNVDVTHAMADFALAQFGLHQQSERHFVLR